MRTKKVMTAASPNCGETLGQLHKNFKNFKENCEVTFDFQDVTITASRVPSQL